MFKKLILTTIAMALPTAAYAGSFDGEIYKSNLEYSITPPSNWTRVDAATIDALKGHLPQNINVSALDRFDVVFFPKAKKQTDTSKAADDERIANNKATPNAKTPPIDDETEHPEFVPTISVLAIQHMPKEISDEYAKAYADNIKENINMYASYAKDFKVLNSTHKPTMKPDKGYVFNIEFQADEYSLEIEQAVIFHNDYSYIVTCTKNASETKLNDTWCQKIVASMKFN